MTYRRLPRLLRSRWPRRGAGLVAVSFALVLSIASSDPPAPQRDSLSHTFLVEPGTAPGFDYVATQPPLASEGDSAPTTSLEATLQCTLPNDAAAIRMTEHALPPTDGIHREVVNDENTLTFYHTLGMRCTDEACDIGIRWQVERDGEFDGEVRCVLSGIIEVETPQDEATVTFGLTDLEGVPVTPTGDSD